MVGRHLIAQHYDLMIHLSPDGLSVRAEVTVRNDQPWAVSELVLDLNPRSQVTRACSSSGRAARIDTVTSPMCAVGSVCRLTFAESLPAERSARLLVEYTLGQESMLGCIDPSGCYLRGLWEDLWLPVPDAMAASFVIDLHMPPSWTPALPTAVLSPDGTGTYHILIETPCPDLDLLAAAWQPHSLGHTQNLLFPEFDPDAAAFVASVANEALVFYEQWLERLAPKPFTIAAIPEGIPAIVNIGLMALPITAFDIAVPYRTVNLVSHEVAHTWWGGLISDGEPQCRWLIEALAHFAQMRFVEHYLGVPLATQGEHFRAQAVDSPFLSVPLAKLDNRSPEEWAALRVKGTLFFHELIQQLGSEETDQAIRRLAKQARFTAAGFLEAIRAQENLAVQGLVTEWVSG